MAAQAQSRRQPPRHDAWPSYSAFELLRRHISQSGVQTHAVVGLLNELAYVQPCPA